MSNEKGNTVSVIDTVKWEVIRTIKVGQRPRGIEFTKDQKFVLVAADESEVFASYLPYRNWDPRPVAGSAGLIPKSWDPAHDQWGAEQLQNRFVTLNKRRMTAPDGQAWAAARMIGEAASRKATDPKAMLDYFKSSDFTLAAFKGQRLTLRDWNLQLRQPILLADGRVIVSVSPQEGFLHQVSELDTLGFDRPETKCRLK